MSQTTTAPPPKSSAAETAAPIPSHPSDILIVAAHQAAQRAPHPAPTQPRQTQAAPRPQAAPAAPSDAAYQAAWANAMSTVAAECVAGMAQLSPAEREQASLRASILNSCASQLLTGKPAQPLRPGDRGMLAPPAG